MNPFARQSDATLLAMVNNDDGTMLADMAKQELARRGSLPDWATPPSAPNVDAGLEAAATPIEPDPDLTPPRPSMARGVVGPRTRDGRDPAPAPTFSSQEEADKYYTRPRHPVTGQLLPSQADMAMEQRGFVATDTPDGGVAYQLGAPASYGPPNESVRRMLWSYRNSTVGDTDKPAWMFESRTGPTGEFDALVPTPELRAHRKAQETSAFVGRLAAKTGMSRAELEGMTPQERAEVLKDDFEAKKAERKNLVARNAMLAGGSQNLNPVMRAQIGVFNELGNEDLNDWQRMVLADTVLRAPQEMTPLGVQAVGAANAMRMMTADAFAGGLPEAKEARERAELMRVLSAPPEQQVAYSRARGEKMGTGISAPHVQSRWNYWMDGSRGASPQDMRRREDSFRKEMMEPPYGYSPEEIDEFIDGRRAPPPPPGTPPPGVGAGSYTPPTNPGVGAGSYRPPYNPGVGMGVRR